MKGEICFIILIISLIEIATSFSVSSNEDTEFDSFTTPYGKYILGKENLNWDQAKEKCKYFNAKLVEIETRDELMAVQAEMSQSKYKLLSNAWTGGRGAQPSESPGCAFFWHASGRKVSLPVEEHDGPCIPGNARQFLRVQLLIHSALKSLHATTKIPYICEY